MKPVRFTPPGEPLGWGLLRLGACAFVAAVILEVSGAASRPACLAAYLVGLLLAAAGPLMVMKARSGIDDLLERHDYRVCVRCRYPLPPEPDTGACPECGLAYDLRTTRERWQAWRYPSRPVLTAIRDTWRAWQHPTRPRR